MMRSMFSAISGLKNHQTFMDVVGNNIANVNTVAFKSSRALFKPQFYVTDMSGSPPSSDFGHCQQAQKKGCNQQYGNQRQVHFGSPFSAAIRTYGQPKRLASQL